MSFGKQEVIKTRLKQQGGAKRKSKIERGSLRFQNCAGCISVIQSSVSSLTRSGAGRMKKRKRVKDQDLGLRA